jgi:hypothetical protein
VIARRVRATSVSHFAQTTAGATTFNAAWQRGAGVFGAIAGITALHRGT